MSVRILIADDHSMVLEGLSLLLEQHDDLSVVGLAKNGQEAIHMAESLSPDVVVMDISMPELNGVEATRRLLSLDGNCAVIALSMHSERKSVLEMINAGARGYILKDAAFGELVSAIRVILGGDMYFSPPLLHYMADVIKSEGEEVGGVLTSREKEVLQLIAEGHSTKEIAAALTLSIKTIESHRSQIMRKLQIDSVAGLTRYALKEGISQL